MSRFPQAAFFRPYLPDEAGFTLIEALVAMTILALSATALIGAAQVHVQRIGALETRTIAQWVAENEMVMARLSGLQSEPTSVSMLGLRWAVNIAVTPTSDPELASIEIRVSELGNTEPLATFGGFTDIGAPQQ